MHCLVICQTNAAFTTLKSWMLRQKITKTVRKRLVINTRFKEVQLLRRLRLPESYALTHTPFWLEDIL